MKEVIKQEDKFFQQPFTAVCRIFQSELYLQSTGKRDDYHSPEKTISSHVYSNTNFDVEISSSTFFRY